MGSEAYFCTRSNLIDHLCVVYTSLYTFQAGTLEVSNECPPAPYLRAIQQRSKALSAQGRATRQLKQRARARLTRKRQKTRFVAEFKAAAARTNRSRRWARCAISSVRSQHAGRRRLQRAAGMGEVFFPPSGIGLRGALPRAARRLLGPRRRHRNRAKRGSLLSPAHILEEANVLTSLTVALEPRAGR